MVTCRRDAGRISILSYNLLTYHKDVRCYNTNTCIFTTAALAAVLDPFASLRLALFVCSALSSTRENILTVLPTMVAAPVRSGQTLRGLAVLQALI